MSNDHKLGEVVPRLGRALGLGATAGLTADLAGLRPGDAAIVFGATTAVGATREFAGYLRGAPRLESEGALREEMADWLTALYRSLRHAAANNVLEKFQVTLASYIQDARHLNDDKLEAALIHVRAQLRIMGDFDRPERLAELLQAIDRAFARAHAREVPELRGISAVDYLANGCHSRAYRLDDGELFQLELQFDSYSVLWSTPLVPTDAFQRLHQLLPHHEPQLMTRGPDGDLAVQYEPSRWQDEVRSLPTSVTFVRLEYEDRIFTWESDGLHDTVAPRQNLAELGFLAEHVDWRYVTDLIRTTGTRRVVNSADKLVADAKALASHIPQGDLSPGEYGWVEGY